MSMAKAWGSSYVLLPKVDVHAAVVVPGDDELQRCVDRPHDVECCLVLLDVGAQGQVTTVDGHISTW